MNCERHIPRTMSTQHPDNVVQPFFARDDELSGDDEVREALYAFTQLECDEQMWDFEGKEGDSYVVKKILTLDEQFFKQKKLGKDIFITIRVPNPAIERTEAKVLLETLESIPRSYDAARMVSGEERAPIFEVIMPMTASVHDINRVYYYYRDFVIGKQHQRLHGEDYTIAEWVGESSPKEINVIPLFEDYNGMLSCADILKEYCKDKTVPYLRVFFARSDPAVNYGLVGAVLLNLVALARTANFEKTSGIPVYPILGVGSAPFRGHAGPHSIGQLLSTYPSVATFTIQSSFKYDHPVERVVAAVKQLNAHIPQPPREIDEKRILDIIQRYTDRYQKELQPLIPLVQKISPLIPRRRKRKMHIGLFGYSRQLNGHALPRAIPFVASLYSIGVPPEVLGLSALTANDIAVLKEIYPSFTYDLSAAVRFCAMNPHDISNETKEAIQRILPDGDRDKEYITLSQKLRNVIFENSPADQASTLLELARKRGFLG